MKQFSYSVNVRPQRQPKIHGGFLSILLIFCSLSVIAQTAPATSKIRKKAPAAPAPRRGSSVIDDTTKNPYGPNTVMSTTESSLFFNKNIYTPLDTSFTNFHRWTYVQRSNNFYKDLGNMGTALSSIYPVISSTIGATSGFTAYAPYYNSEEPRYFDTKSPFTSITGVWGGNGRAITKIEFTRSVHSRWNFGFNYRPIWVDRQVQRVKSARQTISQYYDFYSTYKSKDSKYLLVANYRRMRHRVFETGGVSLNSGDPYKKYFDPNAQINFPIWTSSVGQVTTEEYRSGIHLFQHYQLAKPFQVYNVTDVTTQKNKFINLAGATTFAAGFFDYNVGDTLKTSDEAAIKVIQTETGIKGNAGPLFYDYYFKLRSYNYTNHYMDQKQSVLGFRQKGLEQYVGARMALKIDSLTELSGNAEFMIDGHYRIEGDWKSKYLDAFIRSTLAKPGLMQNAYIGSHSQWNNSFGDVSSQQLGGFLKATVGPLSISPGATFTTLHNYIYFKEVINADVSQQVLPYQSNFQILFAPELRLNITLFKRLSIRTQSIISTLSKNDGGGLQIPHVFLNGQLSYEGSFFKSALHVQMGVDAHWQSTYYGLGYATAIQQFYVQNSVATPSFPLVDLFLNAKLKRGRIFVKYQNLVQAFTGSGYTPTPNYPGAGNLLDFGFILILFD